MSLDWTEKVDWRAKFFGLPARRLPNGYRSHARAAWDAEHAARQAARQEETQRFVAHHRRLLEPAPAESLASLVARFGADAVETILRHSDPRFTLPPDVTGEEQS